MRFLDPGDGHPHAPCAPAVLAKRLGVPTATMLAWDGLPRLADGRVDPYAVTAWLSWGRLGLCPVLERRWRTWMRWFTTPAKTCRLRVRRAQTCWLPEARPLVWLVPEPEDAPGQRVLARTWQAGEPAGAFRRLELPSAASHAWSAEDDVELAPQRSQPRDAAQLAAAVAEVVAGFAYRYRRHDVPPAAGAVSGTCLDLALAVGPRLGRPWRLVSGVVAHRSLANAHFWIEIEDPAGWCPVDPTIPAVARMLGADWHPLVAAGIGRHDARRIRIAAAAPDDCLGGIGGRLDAAGDEALYCTDWAVGACSWSVAAA